MHPTGQHPTSPGKLSGTQRRSAWRGRRQRVELVGAVISPEAAIWEGSGCASSEPC